MEVLRKNIITIIIVIAAILILTLLKDWWKPTLIKALGGYNTKETTIVRDTIVGESKIDTIEFVKKYIETHGDIIPKDTIEIEVIKWLNPVTNDEEEIETKEFDVAINDSLIEGIINIRNRTNGDLLFAKFNYNPKFPKYIREEVPIYIKETVTETLTNKKSYIGVGLGINTELAPSANVNYLTKDMWDFEANIEKDFNNVNTNDVVIGLKLTKYF